MKFSVGIRLFSCAAPLLLRCVTTPRPLLRRTPLPSFFHSASARHLSLTDSSLTDQLLTYHDDDEDDDVIATEVSMDCKITFQARSIDELLDRMRNLDLLLPPRDLKILFRSNQRLATSLMPRPKSRCFLLEIEHLSLICLKDRCIILNPRDEIVKSFVEDLCYYRLGNKDSTEESPKPKTKGSNKPTARDYHKMLTCSIQKMDFEHVVLEQALANITARYTRHVELTKPTLELLLYQIELDPAVSMLRRLLAFRKSLIEFETGVHQLCHVLENLLNSDEDMAGFYLTSPVENIADNEVELLVEAYSHDLGDIVSEIKTMKDMVEETNQFINTHLDTVRNRLIRMGLFMDMAMMSLTVSAVIASVFGMNLVNGLENRPAAFFVVVSVMTGLTVGVYSIIFIKYVRNIGDASTAHSYVALRNFFQYVDELDRIVELKGKSSFTKTDFKEVLVGLTGTKVTSDEAEFIFKMFDVNKDGTLNLEEVKLESAKRKNRKINMW